MKLYVIRHCSTECSEKKIYCGETDVPLSERGKAELARLKEEAKGLVCDLVISSPLLRARETAEAVAGARKIPVLFDARLKERVFGAFERTDAEREDGKVFRHNFAVRYPGGESYLDVAARVIPMLAELKEKYPGKDLLLVTHGSVCRVIRAYLLGMKDGEFYSYSQPPASAEVYEL